MKHLVKIENVESIDNAAQEFLSQIGSRHLLAFHGKMGAGKTTFTVAICKALGVVDKVCSPTFTIVNEYCTSGGQTIYHFDFYRIKSLSEAMDIGIEDYFYSGKICIMEWPENIDGLLPEETLIIDIAVRPDGVREISWDD